MKFDRLPARLVFAQSKLALTALSLTLSHGERGLRILRFNHFGLLCHLEFPCHPIPSPRGRGDGRGQSTKPVSQFRRQSSRYGSCYKTRFTRFRRPPLCRKRKPKRSSVGYAHDHTASSTTRSSESASINEVKANVASFVETQIQISDDLWVKVAGEAHATTAPIFGFSAT